MLIWGAPISFFINANMFFNFEALKPNPRVLMSIPMEVGLAKVEEIILVGIHATQGHMNVGRLAQGLRTLEQDA